MAGFVLWPDIADWLRTQFPGKTKWDYIEKIVIPIFTTALIPIVVAGGVFVLDGNAKERERNREEKEIQERERIRKEETKNRILQLYFDRISTLLIETQVIILAKAAKKTSCDHKDPVVESTRGIIKAYTLNTLKVFSEDTEKKNSAIHFLFDSGIMEFLMISLEKADLSGVDLSSRNLKSINLDYANLSGANLQHADLSGAILNWADLSNANLSGAILEGSTLCLAKFHHADMTSVRLVKAYLFKADLANTKLQMADLTEADLHAANFSGANLTSAVLNRSDLENVKWNQDTTWPDHINFNGAKNMPDDLKELLGLLVSQ